ncbi:MAG: relaxase domain-containing protein, partial [Lentisphaeria bacterium]|nr:relaxase domain-containing protein [Lentisphaeria bacterium]
MFNMTKIRASNAAGKSFYANHLASNDYYSEHEKVIGFWRGSLAENFGLAGQEVTGSVFSLFQRNINPATGDNLTQKKVSGGPRFFDFQVAAPKSVSVMALFDDRLTAAHQAAVREAMVELEALAAVRVRAGENVRTNNHENTGKLIYAEFMHDTSRALDPQLHTHNVVCNVTNADGQYKALETLEMCKAIRYAGKVYHNALARKCRELGYELTPVLDRKQNVLWFDLKGVPEEVMKRFSKRRKQIEEAEAAFIAEHGRKPTLTENNAISNSTRSAKMQTSTRETVRDLQLKQLSEKELAQLISLVKPGAVIEAMDREQCQDVIRETMAELFERESVVTQDKLLAEVLNYSLGSFELNDLKNVLQDIPELKNLGGEAVNPFYSPQEVIEREQNSIESVEDQQGIFEPLAPDFVPFEGNDSRREQADLIRGLLASPDRFNLFRGVAGAGKTSTLQEFCKGLKSANVENIVVVAPTNSATDVLKQEGFEQSQTVASFLFSGEKPSEKSYIIIDEAGLNSLREGYEILKLARKNNYRVLFVGDARQHNAVESGDFFRLLEDYSRIRKFELNQIHRQRNEEYRRGIFECSQGQFEQAFERFDRQDFIHEGKDYLDAAAAKFMEFTHDGTDLSQAIMVAPTHAECDRLTAALREKLKVAKRLGTESQTVTVFRSWNKPKAWMEQAKNYHEGMNLSFIRNLKSVAKSGELDTVAAVENGRIRLKSGRSLTLKEASQFVDAGEVKQIELRSGDLIQFRANRKDLKIYNGTMARVSRKAGYVDLLDKSGAVRCSIELPAGYAAFDYGWVTTSHKSQGRTAQNVVAAAEKMDAKAFYVALSRGREQLSMHCPDKALLKQHLLRNSGNRLSVHDLIRDREIPPNAVLPFRNEVRKQKAALLPDFSYKEISARIKRTTEQVKRLVRNPGVILKMRNHRAKFNRHVPDKDENKSMFFRFISFFKTNETENVEAPIAPIEFKARSRKAELWKIYYAMKNDYQRKRREYHALWGKGKFR